MPSRRLTLEDRDQIFQTFSTVFQLPLETIEQRLNFLWESGIKNIYQQAYFAAHTGNYDFFLECWAKLEDDCETYLDETHYDRNRITARIRKQNLKSDLESYGYAES